MADKATLLNSVIDIARQAGREIMEIYDNGLVGTVYKADSSPLTKADILANDVIVSSLDQLTPNVPIISEELLNKDLTNKFVKEPEVWLVDPLDGTKDFLKHNGEFSVNIALIKDQKPVLGVVFAPAFDTCYYGTVGQGAWKQIGSKPPVPLKTSHKKRRPIITVSRSHLDQATEHWLAEFGPHKLIKAGSSLKFCYLADNTADIYPRLTPIMEWDVAAADAILRLAGGKLTEIYGSAQPLYNKADLHQPPFIAISS